MSGAESMAIGSLITTCGGLMGVRLSKCRCIYRRDEEGCCGTGTACGFSDKPLNDHHEIDIFEYHVADIPVLIITKKT